MQYVKIDCVGRCADGQSEAARVSTSQEVVRYAAQDG